jgi:NADH-quinone oxidoreductase subunit L
MTVPLMILALGALLFGFLFKNYFIGDYSESFWDHSIVVHHEEHHHIPFYIYYLPIVLGFLGLFIAWYMYIKNTKLASDIAKMNKPLYEFLLNKWYFDEIYNFLLVRPAIAIGRILWKFLDEYIIDGFGPNGIASLAINLSKRAKKIQSGYIYHYAFAILIGLSLLITFFIFKF